MAKRKSANAQTGIDHGQAAQDALRELDRAFHEKARLGIMTAIIGNPDGMNFNELKTLCGLTDGNLNGHLSVLVEMKILSVKKSGRGRNTNSLYRLTAKGRRAFERYLSALETILNTAKQSAGEPAKPDRKTQRGDGLSPATG